MKAKIIGSGSSGNMTIFESGTGCRLVVDIGFPFPVLKRHLNFDLSNTFLIVDHFHVDHFNKNAVKDAMKAGVDVYALKSSFEYYGLENERRAHFIEPDVTFEVGEYVIYPFEVKHNCPCVAFVIVHPEMGPTLYLTDSGYVDIQLEGIQNYFLEANHDSDLVCDRVFDSKMNSFLGNRVLEDHMSIQNTIKLLGKQDLSIAERIVLLHLSSGNANPRDFKERVEKAYGVPTCIAVPGLTIDLTPF